MRRLRASLARIASGKSFSTRWPVSAEIIIIGAQSRNFIRSRTFRSNCAERACLLILNRVPLVTGDNDRAAGVVRVTGDVRIKRRWPFLGVNQQRLRHPRAPDSSSPSPRKASPPSRRVLPLRRIPAVSIRRNYLIRSFQQRVDRVASGAGNRRNNHALFAKQPIQQRRLADVRTADNRQTQLAASCEGNDIVILKRGVGSMPSMPASLQMSNDASSSSPNPIPCSAETGNTSSKPNDKTPQPRLPLRADSDLFAATNTRLPVARSSFRQLFIERCHTLSRINHPDQCLRIINREACLLENICRNDCIVVGHDAASIDNRKALARPFDFAVDPIAGNSRLVADNRPCADQSAG